VHLEHAPQQAAPQHRAVIAGLVLCGFVGAGWVVATHHLLAELRRGLGGRRRAVRAAPRVPVAPRFAGAASLAPRPLILGTPDCAGHPPVPSVASGPRDREALPEAGPVEVRLLRREPDLTGELRQPPPPAAVELVAFLALHGGTAGTGELCVALGAAAAGATSADGGVRRVAAAARRSLGHELLPPAGRGEPYRLAAAVSCDWPRLQIARARAERERASGDVVGELGALRFALDLVGDGLPRRGATPADRFDWLDAEGTLGDIDRCVLDVTHRLGALGLALGDLDLVELAVEGGRRVVPESSELRELASLAASARSQAARSGAVP
jgi:hypothetical protein